MTLRRLTAVLDRLTWMCVWIALPLTALAEGYGAPAADIDRHLQRLVRAYPDFVRGYDPGTLFLKSGAAFPISDGRTTKSFTELIEKPDVDDMFFAAYPAGTDPKPPARNQDPGRVRFEPLFVAMYGDCRRGEVTKRLRTIAWLPRHGGGTVAVTTVNGVDKALERVSAELDLLSDDVVRLLKPSAGTYACRTVAGSGVRSMHAYGAAIDLDTSAAHYWRWSGGPGRWQNRYPKIVVDIFEKHGFIWGGRWYHYDTMHFEYRPELLPDPASR